MAVVPIRVSNALGDVVLTAELLAFLIDWLRQRPREARSYKAAYYLYALNLFSAVLFTSTGAVLHITDPLPQQATPLWVWFILTCVSTPILFPVISMCALYPKMSPASALLCCAWLLLSASTHASLMISGADLSGFLQLPEVSLCGQVLDGHSIGGRGHGISFDLLSSIPCLRGDCMFVHAGLFTAAVFGTLLLIAAFLKNPAARPWNPVDLGLVRRLGWAVAIMLCGQVTMIPLLTAIGVARTLDVWHASIFIVMALAYSSLRGLLCEADGSVPTEMVQAYSAMFTMCCKKEGKVSAD